MKDNSLLLHYEEYGENDYEIIITPTLVREFVNETGPYNFDKANIIAGYLDKTVFIDVNGYQRFFEEDEGFYNWAKDRFRKNAQDKFGYRGYLFIWVDGTGEYLEEKFDSLVDGMERFKKCSIKGITCALLQKKRRTSGWEANPVRSHNWRKIAWKFYRRHK